MARQRRPRGSGSVYQSPPGVWWARLPKDVHGKQPKKRASSEAEAWKVLKQLERDRAQQLRTERRPTFAEFVPTWLDEQRTQVKVTSYEDYEQVTHRAFVPVFGKRRLDAIERGHIQKWANEFSDTHAPSTVTNHLRILRSIFALAVTDRLIAFNPVTGVKLPKHLSDGEHAQRPHIALTFAEAYQLLQAAADYRLRALLIVALATGMRQGELLGLRWHSVQLEGEQPAIRIVEQLQLVGNEPVLITPKSKKSRREIPIDPDVVQALREHWAQTQEERRGADWQEFGLVFPNAVGRPMHRSILVYQFKALLERAGLPDMRFHDLRHTAGSLMLDSGIELLAVSEILGHSNVNVTAMVYAHSYAENKRRAVASVMNGFRKVRGEA